MNIKEKKDELKIKNSNILQFVESENSLNEDNPVEIQESYKNNSSSTFSLLILVILAILVFGFLFFTVYNSLNENITSGISIKGLNVSHLSKSDAKYQVDNFIKQSLPQEITLIHNDFKTSISLDQIDVMFDTKSAVNTAYDIGRKGNIFQNIYSSLSTLFKKANIEPVLKVNEQQLTKNLEAISTQLPDKVEESSYYIENKNLIITPGKTGNIVDIEKTKEAIKMAISDFSNFQDTVQIVVKPQSPDKIDIEKIHSEIYKNPKDAYYTQQPFTVYPSEDGLDFRCTIEEAKQILKNQNAKEYIIPLKVLYPKINTNMIGSEAFPDLLSTYSTKYNVRDKGRTTNLILASNKINGTVIMPGEIFSYNKIVGARTIEAGYKEAPIYVEGKVVPGLGGGICQIASTLYNAVVYANLDIVQRSNHQFIPSYVTASRDATVVYGAIDFQFKNNRTYPIKLFSTVSNGIATFKIFGLKQENDCEIEISSYETGRGKNAIYSEAYKIQKKDGKVINKQLLSKDMYQRH